MYIPIAYSRILSSVISTGRIFACWRKRYEMQCVGEWRNLAAVAERANCLGYITGQS